MNEITKKKPSKLDKYTGLISDILIGCSVFALFVLFTVDYFIPAHFSNENVFNMAVRFYIALFCAGGFLRVCLVLEKNHDQC